MAVGYLGVTEGTSRGGYETLKRGGPVGDLFEHDVRRRCGFKLHDRAVSFLGVAGG